MTNRWLAGLFCLVVAAGAAWLSGAGSGARPPAEDWAEVAPGVLRTATFPAGYALLDGDTAVLIDAPENGAGLQARGIKKIDQVLLTHHHRDSLAAAGGFLAEGVPVRAPKAAAEWLVPENVRRYWLESLPLRNSRASYFVHPTGLAGIDCTLEAGHTLDWHGWTIRVVDTPGHARDQVTFLARKGATGRLLAFCGGVLAAPGKLWAPFTTDWDHWTDAGLTPAAQSLRRLAGLKPDVLLPAHGAPVTTNAAGVLERTVVAVEELAFLKSFERYTKKRLGNAPQYPFLAREQAESHGQKPWSQISEHLFLTGNTYVLTSRSKDFMVVDPWGKLSADQVAKLRQDRGLGKMEVVLVSHAHWDHYDGIYHLPERDRFEVWSLDRVAVPVVDPFLLHAPFLDPRPVRFDRRWKDGETGNWREYQFRFHHFPGQTEFTMGVETVIDGKRCFFTADNFFHHDQFSGTGGWMGLNRSYPLPYAASAQKVLDAAPDWVLAEHGGPFEFNAEDFRRRVQWGKVSAAAADAVCLSGRHRRDWDPHRVHVEPLVQKAAPGATVRATLVAANPLDRPESLQVSWQGRGIIPDQTIPLQVPARDQVRKEFTVRLGDAVTPGRHVFTLPVKDNKAAAGVDAFFAVDVGP
jgi:glyoxylase-like metal-dependent hydrolase (beta-lactamase superfamily II)